MERLQALFETTDARLQFIDGIGARAGRGLTEHRIASEGGEAASACNFTGCANRFKLRFAYAEHHNAHSWLSD